MRTRDDLVKPVLENVGQWMQRLPKTYDAEHRFHHATYARGLVAALYLQSLLSRDEYTAHCDAIDTAFRKVE